MTDQQQPLLITPQHPSLKVSFAANKSDRGKNVIKIKAGCQIKSWMWLTAQGFQPLLGPIFCRGSHLLAKMETSSSQTGVKSRLASDRNFSPCHDENQKRNFNQSIN